MTDYNLPPGVSISDLPGSRPEDLHWEYLLDNTYDMVQDELHAAVEPILQLILGRVGIEIAEHEMKDLVSYYREELLK